MTIDLYQDTNGNGVIDAGEPVLTSTTTAGGGAYDFIDLPPGDYIVDVTDTGSVLADSTLTNGTDPVAVTGLTAGQDYNDADFGYQQTNASIGDRIWLDENGDGMQDVGEAGISGVTVYIDDDGTPGYSSGDSQAITDSNGNYLIKNLSSGTHDVTVKPDTLPAGLELIFDEDSDTTSPDGTTSATVSAGGVYLTADFGYNWVSKADTDTPAAGATGAIGDRIWNDADNDGVQDPNETGLVGVTVKLLTDDNKDGVYGGAGDNPAVTTTTGPDGRYIFDGLAPGGYIVEADSTTLPAGYNTVPSGDPDSNPDGRTSSPIVLAPGDVFVNADFGYNMDNNADPTTPENGGGSSIGDIIYLDTDADGTYNSVIDTGIPGVSIVLEDAGGNIIGTAVTDTDGGYQFDGLPDGDYTIRVVDNGNLLDGLSPTADPNGEADNESALTLSGADNLDQDFGYTPAGHITGEGLIGDTIFLDLNNNNGFDVGEGLEDVTVYLYDSSGTVLLATAVTDKNGQYNFGNLNKTATYQVHVDTTTLP
ncbi:MAG: hypothetical protein D3924_08965, partial [Candidatus Electrothrix sp. AR4]|nr:hypothetical protein [Candidatus Electrothrix sp. AR4]